MIRFPSARPVAACAALALVLSSVQAPRAAEVIRLSESTWDEAAPHGKEVDCIYGDWVLRNDHLVAVIAETADGRNANMTVRNVGGSVIDLTTRRPQSDQLSAYYPLGARYKLAGPVRADNTVGNDGVATEAKTVTLRFRGPSEDGHTTADVIYELSDDARWLKITTRVTNLSDQPINLALADAIRADSEFEFGQDPALGLFWAYDKYWRQAYGSLVPDTGWRFDIGEPERRRGPALNLVAGDPAAMKLPAGESREIVRYLFPAANTIEARALANAIREQPLVEVALEVRDADGPVQRADVAIASADGKQYAHGSTNKQGKLTSRLPAGNYKAVVSAQGRGEKSLDWKLAENQTATVELPAPGYVVGKITGEAGAPIACKVQFIGQGDTPSPNFGPDSAVHGVRNLYYTENGQFRAPLAPGQYQVIVSHGPEFDAVFTTLSVERGQDSPLAAELKRTVDTRGWLSADFHSHSSPSGDNTSSQRGRVLNLVAEHVEFAPCTEHNRLTVYDGHLAALGLANQVLTCPGIELTGSPGSINHQNAFPMVVHPRTQDGGGPRNDVDPLVQIERLAMWDDKSDKLVQINHPNMVQMAGDRDLDGSPDGGFEKMFSFMDVIEVHPLDRIFDKPDSLPGARERGSSIFHWMQLMNVGYRIPGVVNTDAHWNFHGSGGLRNYIKSSSDDPTQAKVPQLVHECEHGRIVMTNGPFMEVSAQATEGEGTADVGDDLAAPAGKLNLKVRVQCPNWFTVNRVQVFANGAPLKECNFTKRTHAAMFHGGTVVFDENIPLAIERDAHLIVACVGEGETVGDVMGPDWGKQMPMAVGNPIFVDVDGNGFEPNGDMLGLPLPLDPGMKPSKGHHHHHDDE